MSLKQKMVYSGLLCLALLSCTLASLHWLVPFYLNSERFSRSIRDLGLIGFAWNVRSVGLTGADIGDLRIGDPEKKALSVETVKLDYSIKGLYHRRMERVRFSGIEVNGGIRNGRFYFENFDPGPLLGRSDQKASAPQTPAESAPPFSIGRLEFRGVTVVMDLDGVRFRVPIAVTITPQKNGRFRGTLKAFPRGQEISAVIDFDLGEKTAHLAVKADRLHMERFGDVIERIPGLAVSGDASIVGSADLQLTPFRLSNVDASVGFKNRNSFYKRFKLKTVHDNAREDAFIRIKIQSADGENWDIASTSAIFESPAPFRISRIKARIAWLKEKVSYSGDFMIETEGLETDRLSFDSGLKSGWRFSATVPRKSGWEVNLQTVKPGKHPGKKYDKNSSTSWGATIDDVRYTFRMPEVTVFARSEAGNITAGADVMIPEASASAGPISIRIPTLSLKGNARFDNSGVARATVTIRAAGAVVKRDSAFVTLPETVLSGKIRLGEDGVPHIDGLLKIVDGDLADLRVQTRVEGIDVGFPFQWPWKASETDGTVSVRSIRWDRLDLGPLSGTVRQDKHGVVFKGNHPSKMIPGLGLNLKGEALFFGGKKRMALKFDTRYRQVSPMDLGRFHSSAKGVKATGGLSLNGELVFDDSGLRCSINSVLEKAGLSLPDRGVAAENIRLKLYVPDAFKMVTAPRQQLKVETVSLGNIRLQDVGIDFQIEPGLSVFIEKASFKWSGGRVSLLAFRMKPGVRDYDLTLYCDRLKLTDLLSQLGVAEAKGDGEVSGRIHVRIKDGAFKFDDGFLFSTPGEGGTIHVTKADMLTAGIAKNTPQYFQLDLAREALKDYDYEWVRLRLTTKGEQLMFRMEFDGKPANPLPFVYKKRFGGFVRDESGKQLSKFQGIRLNVNLGLPLNKILRYKGIIDNLLNN